MAAQDKSQPILTSDNSVKFGWTLAQLHDI